MTHNDILRRLRYALNIDDSTMLELFRLSDSAIDQTRLNGLLRKEDEEGFLVCSNDAMNHFLDGFIIYKRGKKEAAPGQAKKSASPLTNNMILKKLRIALELHENDMLAVLKSAGMEISRSELTALFRKEGHRNYKECGDQFLRNFLKGLSLRLGNRGMYEKGSRDSNAAF